MTKKEVDEFVESIRKLYQEQIDEQPDTVFNCPTTGKQYIGKEVFEFVEGLRKKWYAENGILLRDDEEAYNRAMKIL